MDGPTGTAATPHPTGLPDNYTPPFVAPNLVGLQSFNLVYIPEPSTVALIGLGAAGLLISRRLNGGSGRG